MKTNKINKYQALITAKIQGLPLALTRQLTVKEFEGWKQEPRFLILYETYYISIETLITKKYSFKMIREYMGVK